MNVKISKRNVDAAKPKERDYFIWDTATKGFGLKVTPKGNKIYIFQYRWPGKKTPERATLGRHGDPWTPDKARAEAEKLRGDVRRGVNPRESKRKAIQEERSAISIAELCDLYLKEGCTTKKASTIATDRGRIERHIKPLLGKRKVRDISSADVRRFMNDIANGKTAKTVKTGQYGLARVTGGKGAATRTVGLLGGIFSFAIQEGMRKDNPVHGVKRFPDKKGERFLTNEELSRLGIALREAEAEGENPVAISAIRLLILTGCRKSEILTLRWKEVDFENACLRLEDSKTREKVVPLGAPALETLASQTRQGNCPYVFPGSNIEKHLVGLPKIWERVRARAGLQEVRLHDLRHTFASTGAVAGLGLAIVGRILGHRDPKTTNQYAHIADDPAKMAADKIAGSIADALGTNKQQNVTRISFNKYQT